MSCLFDRYVVLDPISILKNEMMNNSQTKNIDQREFIELQSAIMILEKESKGMESSKSIIDRKSVV